jgi:high frequency lysogenization protein
MSIEESTLALAGVFQAAELVRSVARQGLVDQTPFESSLYSILQVSAESTVSVYGELSGLKCGLTALSHQLQRNDPSPESRKREMEAMRYALGAILLERKLSKRSDVLARVGEGIEEIREFADSRSVAHPEVVTQMARLYSNTLSTFDYRIQVSGEPRYLENASNADKVRALLLAGVRSAVLWRQKGGTRLQLLFSRGKILRATQQFLEQISVVDRIIHPPR